MRSGDVKSKPSLGFLTVIEHAEHGFFGGYLVLNLAGRPLEFHCTTPVRPNRAQRILYGPTLEPYVFGEQIGQALLSKAATQPMFVCTDRAPALAVRESLEIPVALVLPPERQGGPEFSQRDASTDTPAAGDTVRIDSAHASPPLARFRLGRNRLAVSTAAAGDQRLITERFGEAAESFDLAEPFERIREAIEEARRGGQSG